MIKPRSIALALSAMLLAAAGATAAYAAPHGARSTSAGPTINLAAAARGCAVVHVALHGTKAPTVTCISRTRLLSTARHTGKLAPGTSQVGCGAGGVNLIVSPNNSQNICFSGTGYLGLNPSISDVADIGSAYNSWFRIYYNGAGTFLNLAGGWYGIQFYPYFSMNAEGVGMTQICDDCGYHS